MINNEEIEKKLSVIEGVHFVKVEGDGYHYHLTIVSDAFIGKTRVARQQWVYAQLKEYITSGRLHALTMKTWTQEEWGKQHG
ncbi:BolA like protein [Legionella rubrilucens]|uniref:BolA like protein n=1 Tax=Legionella rubrilucens TaxID=458 RepID=A0A0W0XWR5_9GAMM|nr:BolA/IbaG family iron-sulfur metabolism protein [Legionella rubrilucens]KTD48882.1 BolA like protein [Legionella rubrilucens]